MEYKPDQMGSRVALALMIVIILAELALLAGGLYLTAIIFGWRP